MRVNPNYIANLAVALNTSQAAEQHLTEELSSGVRINSAGRRSNCGRSERDAFESDSAG